MCCRECSRDFVSSVQSDCQHLTKEQVSLSRYVHIQMGWQYGERPLLLLLHQKAKRVHQAGVTVCTRFVTLSTVVTDSKTLLRLMCLYTSLFRWQTVSIDAAVFVCSHLLKSQFSAYRQKSLVSFPWMFTNILSATASAIDILTFSLTSSDWACKRS